MNANNVESDANTNTVTASGNVEATKDDSKLTSDKIIYDKNNGNIKAVGNVEIRDLEVGKIYTPEAEIKSDFSSGIFLENKMIFRDGSYLTSKRAERKSPMITVLKKPIFSLCPNKEIATDNKLAGEKFDTISFKASEATIDREQQIFRAKHGILRIYNVPVLYTPYLSFSFPNNKRKTGFLAPKYIKNNRFGLGIIAPFFLDIAPNKDLTITPKYYLGNKQLIVENDYRHLTKYGQYNVNLEVSNNKINSNTDKLVLDRTKNEYRWFLSGESRLNWTPNLSFRSSINTAGDRNYLRDYNNNFLAYTVSDAKFEHTNNRQYYGAKAVRIQELISVDNQKTQPFIFPTLESYIETKPMKNHAKLAIASNLSVIDRSQGLQYRRASFTPEAKLPVNFHGNLLNFNARMQSDIYSLQNRPNEITLSGNKLALNNTNYKAVQTNYRPEFSASWRLPLIQKKRANTLMVEPIANLVFSDVWKKYGALPNEDSNNSELTVNNIFVNNRIAGFDRNEVGSRTSYGVKTSTFNKYGQFGLTLGQSYRFKSKTQDVIIRGFNNNNKSNFVGEFYYKIPKVFNSFYSFQLNESNYRNDVNSVVADLTLNKFFISGSYLLIRKNITGTQDISQGNSSFGIKITPQLTTLVFASHDFIIGRTMSRGISVDYNGCCAIFNFAVKENNSINLTKPQKSFQINFIIKNL